jgi:hypothetical protein
MRNASEQVNTCQLSNTQKIELSEIYGIHPRYTEALDNSKVDEILTKSSPQLTKELIEIFLSVNPLLVHRFSKKTYCFGNIPGFRVASSQLDKNDKVSVRFYEGRITKNFEQIIINELIVRPLVLQASPYSSPEGYPVSDLMSL